MQVTVVAAKQNWIDLLLPWATTSQSQRSLMWGELHTAGHNSVHCFLGTGQNPEEKIAVCYWMCLWHRQIVSCRINVTKDTCISTTFFLIKWLEIDICLINNTSNAQKTCIWQDYRTATLAYEKSTKNLQRMISVNCNLR